MELVIRVPGSCGELLQGFCGQEPLLLTCPIDCYSTVRVRPGQGRLVGGGPKAKKAFQLAKDYVQAQDLPYDFYLSSDLAKGKGMASSSADIAAVIAAVAAVTKYMLSEKIICKLATRIEPTDSVFCRGLTLFQYRSGKILRQFSPTPLLKILAFDGGGRVDTLPFQAAYDAAWQKASPLVRTRFFQALQLLDQPLTRENLAQAATISSTIQAELFSKTSLRPFLTGYKKWGALGVNIAHSGSVVGLLFSPEWPDMALRKLAGKITAVFPAYQYLKVFHLQSGGIWLQRKE